MKFLPQYQIDHTFFENVPKGTEFIGKMRGFRPSKDFWIGNCVLNDITRISENGDILNGSVDCIFCKIFEKSLTDLLNLRQQVKEKSLKFTFKGMSAKGFPIFFHEFV